MFTTKPTNFKYCANKTITMQRDNCFEASDSLDPLPFIRYINTIVTNNSAAMRRTANEKFLFLGELRQSRHVESFRLAFGGYSLFHHFRIVAVDIDRMCEPAEFELHRSLSSQDIGGSVSHWLFPVAAESYRYFTCNQLTSVQRQQQQLAAI